MVVKTNKIIITNPAATTSDLEMTGDGDINKQLTLSATESYTANGSNTMTAPAAVGPNGATGGAVAKWLTIKDANGSSLYIPTYL